VASFDGLSLKTPYRCKNFADISYRSRVITNFVTNFVAMATRVARGKIRLAAFDGPFPKPHYRHKKLAGIYYTNLVTVNFVPKFVATATGVARREI